MDRKIIQKKCLQVADILKKYDKDMWLVLVRETTATPDPAIKLIYGTDVMWITAFIFTKAGDKIVICGHVDEDLFLSTGFYDNVLAYNDNFQQLLLNTIIKYDPKEIAINYSLYNELADGLSLGLYKLLLSYLEGTPYVERLVNADQIGSSLRGQKLPEELEKIRITAYKTEDVLSETFKFIRPGMTDRDIMKFIQTLMDERKLQPAWDPNTCPSMNIGPHSPKGHLGVTGRVIHSGDLIRFDYGVRYDDYCSDIQRVGYVLQPGEMEAPKPVLSAFNSVIEAIRLAMNVMLPGTTGWDVDHAARSRIISAGYAEYRYGTGHEIGQQPHDGGCHLGPNHARYGDTVFRKLELGQTFCIEPAIPVEGFGYLGVEEEVVVREYGAEFITRPQTELILIPCA